MEREQQHNQDLREIYKVGRIPSSETQGQSVGPAKKARQKFSSMGGTFPPVVENFCRAFSPGPTDRPWVSEDGRILEFITC